MTRTIITRTAAMALFIAAFLLLLGADASAQKRGTLAISNNSKCDVTLCGPRGLNCVTIPAGSDLRIEVPCVTSPLYVRTCGTLREIPLGSCIENVNLGPCCARICLVTGIVSCTYFLSIDPVDTRCPCRFE